MSLSVVLSDAELSEQTPREEIGGKAENLRRLQSHGFFVPRFYVVTASALASWAVSLSESNGSGQISSEVDIERVSGVDRVLPFEIGKQIKSIHQRMFPESVSMAVRSSGTSEDGQEISFAGIYSSVIGVSKLDDLPDAIADVWNSGESARKRAYCKQHGLSESTSCMAIIVQQVVETTRAGVCFTSNPVTQNSEEILINTLYGMGEGVVSAGLPVDTFTVKKSTFESSAHTAEKDSQITLNLEEGGTSCVKVETNLRSIPSLTPGEVLQVSQTALAIEAIFGQPQDIEFGFDNSGQLVIFQTRPITTNSNVLQQEELSNSSLGNHIIWDNSNIIESYSGVTTPMTFSFIRRAYSIVYHCFSEVMGISPRVVHQHQHVFNNMLGLFHGRVYYNLRNWYQLVRLFPGYQYNRQFMEAMMGLKEPLLLDSQQVPVSMFQKWFVEFPALLRLLVRSGWNFLWIRKRVDTFQRNFYRHYDEWSKYEYNHTPPHEIMRLYQMMEDKLLWNWQTPIINDFFVMVFYGILRKTSSSWCHDQDGSLQNELICGEGGLQSDEPARLVVQMASLAQKEELLREQLLSQPLKALHSQISDDERFTSFNQLMKRYLDEFGLRCANELKLEALSYCDEPYRVYEMVRNYLVQETDLEQMLETGEARKQEIRRDAERRAYLELSRKSFGFLRRPLFRWVLNNARMGVRNRENMRFARTRIYGVLRKMLRALGSQFYSEGIIDQPEDIFYLTLDEVWDFIKGTAVSTDLSGLANLRRAEYQYYRNESVPAPADRFETFGMAYHRNDLGASRESFVDRDDCLMRGIPCCPGNVCGPVQIVANPSQIDTYTGTILVAEKTDPGWVTIYPAFQGILVERGSVLSHSAIVARELGIPTIVGIPDITKRLRNGEQVRMNGRSGVVEILDKT